MALVGSVYAIEFNGVNLEAKRNCHLMTKHQTCYSNIKRRKQQASESVWKLRVKEEIKCFL